MITNSTWTDALERVRLAKRTFVLGAIDTGKSSFIREALDDNPGLQLIDLDPGQKMLGAPGTLGLGHVDRHEIAIDRFCFVGTTSASSIRSLVRAASLLRDAAGDRPFIANSSGFVSGPGHRLQQLNMEALGADLVIALEGNCELDPILASFSVDDIVRVRKPEDVRRKTRSERRRVRQSALDVSLRGAVPFELPADLHFAPGDPIRPDGSARPLLSVVGASGTDLSVGILEYAGADCVRVFARLPDEPIDLVRLGTIWCKPLDGGWQLLDRQHPSWKSAQLT